MNRFQAGRLESSTDILVCGSLVTGKNACATLAGVRTPYGLPRAALISGIVRLINKDLGYSRCSEYAKFRYDNTLLIILSDHGEEFYEHQGKTHGRLFGEHLLVPLLIKFPGKENRGKVVSAPVRIIDVMPSILDYVTIPSPSMQGVSFLPLLKDDKIVSAHLPVNYTGNDYGIYRAIRLEKDGYAYIHNTTEKLGDEWLIDLKNDPQEQRNLAAERPDLLIRFRAAAAAELYKDEVFSNQTDFRPSESFPVDSNLRKQLKALGYLN